MQTFRTRLLIAICLCLSQQTAFAVDDVDNNHTPAAEDLDSSTLQSAYSATESNDSSVTKDILSEVIIRPAAVLGSATGLALFVVASPFSGLASILDTRAT